MADQIPLRIVYVNGVPTIGEFQSGDTLGITYGGTGTSSLSLLKDALNAIPGGALSGLTDDVGIGFPFSDPAYGDVLTWNGSFWVPEHIPHLAFADYSGAPYDISSVSFLTNLGKLTLQEGEIAWDNDANTIQVQTDASTTQLTVLQVSSASNDGDILLWDGKNGYYYPTSAFVDVSAQVDINTSTLENTLDASDLSVELSAISAELSSISVDISSVGIEVSSVSIQLSSLFSSITLPDLGDVGPDSPTNDGDILIWDNTNGYYYPTSSFVSVSGQVDLNTSTLENTLDASDLSVELSAISTELSAISIDISGVGIEVSSVAVQLSSLVSSIHLSGLGDVSFTNLSANQHLNWDGTDWINADNDRTEMRVRNGTASPMSRGDVVAIQNAHNQNLVNVILADASQTSAMPALGILDQDLAVGEEGIAITFGKAQGLNTSGLTEGATAYVSPTTPGTITETKPTDPDHLIQNIGIIMRAHASNGAIKVTGIGRANDIDNQTRSDLRFLNGTTVMPDINSTYSGLTEWVEGSGSMSGWDLPPSTDASSNIREYAPDPFNGSSIVWKAYDDGPGDSTPWEGGFYQESGTNISLDTSKDHRYSVFVKQHDNKDGVVYFGPMSNTTPEYAVLAQSTGAHFTNPYFEFDDNPEVDKWYLWVGFINASGKPTGSNNYGDLAGAYSMDGVRQAVGFNEFTFSSTAIYQHLRAFYYGDGTNDSAIGASFWHPRIDALDGNEPSIDDLLKIYTTQHGQLDGLDQNDHPQYLLSSTYADVSSFFPSVTRMPAINSSFSAIPEWTEGTGSQGSEWVANPVNDTESIREYRPDPFQGSSIVWVARDVDTALGADGGFTSSAVPIDSSYTYRICGFVKQHTPTSGGNYFRFGPAANFLSDPTKAVAILANGNLETNPRFENTHSMPTYDEWYLVVGHVQASSTSTPGTDNENTGIWDLEGNHQAYGYDDFIFSSTATQMGVRFEQYNNPNGTNNEIEFFSPRIDKLDGNEPSIDDLLKLFTTQHGQLDGLDQNDHPQYVLSSTNSTLSSTVDSKVNKELVGHYIEPWTEGSYHQNAPIDWTSNGTSSLREFDTDPFGNQSIIWKAIDNDVASDAEGGFNSGKVPADASSTYRFSCFIKQENTASGGAYFGAYAYSSLEGGTSDHRVDVRGADTASGTGSENPYFISNQPMPSTDWYLAVAYLHAYQTETGPSTRQETGVYKVSTGEKVSISIIDRVFDDPTAIGLVTRAYHYNNPAGTGDAIQFFQPRIDLVDGNEPSIADLLGIVPRTDYVLSGVPTMSEGGSSVTGVGACPHPQPFWYGQTTADSTASRSYDWGSAATETEVVCSDHFNWDAANSRLYVSSTGVYEVDVMFMVDGGSDFTAEVIMKVDGTAKNTITHDYVSANSPSEYSGRWVGKVDAGSYITATFQDAAVVVSTSHEAGSTMIVKRLA